MAQHFCLSGWYKIRRKNVCFVKPCHKNLQEGLYIIRPLAPKGKCSERQNIFSVNFQPGENWMKWSLTCGTVFISCFKCESQERSLWGHGRRSAEMLLITWIEPRADLPFCAGGPCSGPHSVKEELDPLCIYDWRICTCAWQLLL